jgi:hypothetical protein
MMLQNEDEGVAGTIPHDDVITCSVIEGVQTQAANTSVL